MKNARPSLLILTAMMLVLASGCENEDAWKAEVAEQYADRQDAQHRAMVELQKEVNQAAKELVQADAQARQEMVTVQRELQQERSAIGQQRDQLEGDRRTLSQERQRDSLLAAALMNFGLVLASLLPLVLCWYLLLRLPAAEGSEVICEVLIEDLGAKHPLLLARPEKRALANDSVGALEVAESELLPPSHP